MMLRSSVYAPAKLNLFLYVIGRDQKHYHLLQSLFRKIPSLSDEITIIVDEETKQNIVDVDTTYDKHIFTKNYQHTIDNNICTKAVLTTLRSRQKQTQIIVYTSNCTKEYLLLQG